MMPSPARDEFRIGWICALPIEIAAAKEMLDVNFGILEEQDNTDTNSYILGQIGKHYIVIAGLGQPGTTSATTVAINMMRTFSESLRIGLMVGIAGGIPSVDHDIRLGDIVVSCPDNTCGGVLQYDMGKVVEDGTFLRIGSLNSVPRSLQTAMTNMRAAALTDDPNYPEYIKKATQRNRRTRLSFGRPDASTDRLFQAEHEHTTTATTCKDCLKEWETSRDTREEADPQIHYGIIASGNTVVKHGATRERLRRKTKALCVEMEAAGLMVDFPCIVVRGICDYADSHKNDQWQGYAALAAASYVKELLSYVPAGHVSQERLAIQFCYEISDEVKEVNKGMKRALHQRENHHRENMIRAFNEEQQKCHQALKTSTYEQYKNINPDRIEGTCQWILENPQYGNWRKSGHNDLLWISADPGCGKSVLSKSLVDIDLKKSTSASVCYFFFKDNEDQNSLATALCAVLHQLFGMQPDLLRHAIPEWKKNGQKIRQEVYELWRILEAAISDPAFSSTICIFDGLDECQSSDQAQLIEKLTVFYTESDSRTRQSWFKFLVTSRPYIEIQDRFRSTTQSFPQIHIRGEEENDQIHEEINLIVKKRVKELGESEGLALETLQRLERQLLQMEHRTYLWLHLAMDDIRNMFRLSFRPEEEMIQLIPTSVSAAYEKILNRVPKDKKKDVRIIFQIIVGARRPLTIEELAMALGIATSSGSQSPTESGLNPEGLDEKIRQLCGLFVFVNTSRKVFLIHQTATEFLVHNLMLSHEQKLLTDITVASHQKYREGFSFRKVCGRSRKWYHTTEAEANLCILKVCLAYLSAGELGSGSLVVRRQSDTGWLLRRTFENLKEYIPQHSFLEYSFVQWENHAIESHSAMLDDLGRLFTKAEIAPDLRDFWLLLMAKEGHKEVAKLLLNNGADVNTKFWSGCTALWSAISSRQEAMVKLLVEMGADINARDEGGQTPLWRAISSRQEVIVKLLVEMGADINARDENGRTPLWSAISNRQEAVAKLLVEMGAVVDTENSNGQTPLWLAISNNHGAIIELLVKKGADINIKDKAGWTPLRWAINTRRGAMVKQLVKMGANINSQGEFGWTPLKWAIRNKQDDMVKLLLEMGAVEAEDKSGQYDATLAATKKAHRAMIVTRR